MSGLATQSEVRGRDTAGVRRTKEGLTRCRVCGCTEREPCNPPCAWSHSDKRGDLCTTCEDIAVEIARWFMEANRPTWATLKREVERLRIEDRARGWRDRGRKRA